MIDTLILFIIFVRNIRPKLANASGQKQEEDNAQEL